MKFLLVYLVFSCILVTLALIFYDTYAGKAESSTLSSKLIICLFIYVGHIYHNFFEFTEFRGDL